MDNSQFRSLLQTGSNGQKSSDGAAPAGFKKPVLGSRARSSIPMTPRVLAGFNTAKDFSRQVAEHQRSADGQPPAKKFRSSAAPKGSKVATGYQDRTLARRTGEDNEGSQDDKEKRLKALEEMYKLQQIDEATLERLKTEIGVGGDLESTHLVKGLDWKLLERVRKGEDLNQAVKSGDETKPEAAEIDVEDELDQALERDVESRKPLTSKTENDEISDAVTEIQPTTRDEILRRLKESRAATKNPTPAPAPALGGKFKKIVSEKKSNKKKFVESINGRRREVLIITNKDGTTKRKSRWLDDEHVGNALSQNQPLGMEIPAEILAKQKALDEHAAAAAEDEDDDIFGGVADYNPLAGINSDSDESDDPEGIPSPGQGNTAADVNLRKGKSRNYFGETKNLEANADDRTNPIMKDPTILAALKRAAGLRRQDEEGEASNSRRGSDTTNVDQEAKHKEFLARLKEQDKADAADLDLGFGESRFGDEDDEEGAVWDDAEGEHGKKAARKRGPRKRKGDKDSVSDVMAVLEGRKKDK